MTNKEIKSLIISDKPMALALMTEKQCLKFIDNGVLDSDDYARWDNAQEEMRCLIAAL